MINFQKPFILIIDDDNEFRNILKFKLQEKFKVIEAENGNKALSLLENNIPQLVLIDLVMPIMNGIDFLFKLKEDKRFNKIKSIVMTNKVDLETEIGEKYKELIKKFGSIALIDKANDLDFFVEMIEREINS